MSHLGICKGSKKISAPGVKREAVEEEDKRYLTKEAATQYRALVARGIYLAQARSDIAFAIKELSRGMAKPIEEDWEALKRLGRHLLGRMREVKLFSYQRLVSTIEVWTTHRLCRLQVVTEEHQWRYCVLGGHAVKSWS